MAFNDGLAWILPRSLPLQQHKMMTVSRLFPGTHTLSICYPCSPFPRRGMPLCRHSVYPANRMLVSSISELIGSLGAGIFPAAASSSWSYSSTSGTSLLMQKSDAELSSVPGASGG